MHGIALNCDNDLSWYDRFIACGIRDAGTTTLAAEAGRAVPVTAAADAMEQHLAGILGAGSFRRDDDLAGLLPAPAAR
jgi:lipoyl(octanoyl) transferase